MMPYVVQPVSPAEAPGLARAMMSAFYQDKHWVLLWPNMSLEDIIEGCTQRLPWNLVKVRTNKRHQKVVDDATGEIVGYARWILPKGFENIWLEAQIPEPSAQDFEMYESRWKGATVNGRSKGSNTAMVIESSGPLDEEEQKIIQDRPYLSLDYLTTIPSHQRKGVAGLLVRSGLVEADKAGLKTIVMSSPAGRKVYERHGFEIVSTVNQDDSKYGGDGYYVNHFLVREPHASSQELV